MKRLLIALACLAIAQAADGENKTDCNKKILRSLSSGTLFSDTLNLNGKYMNELGNYEMCTKRSDTKYFLNLYKTKDNITLNDSASGTIQPIKMHFVMGACTFNECGKDSLASFDFFYIQSA